jgi:hypothetical protein
VVKGSEEMMRVMLYQQVYSTVILLFVMVGIAGASGGFLPGDPMVRITAPPALLVDVDAVLDRLSRDVSRDSGLDPKLLTYYWQRFEAINCMGKKAEGHPIFVDLYVPDFLTNAEVAIIMHSIADSLARNTGINKKWVFVHTHTAEKGRVLLSGEVQ